MIIPRNLVERVKHFLGLNQYETQIWLALLNSGIATAGELAEAAGVPRSRSYDVLESLAKKGLVVIKAEGRPIKYVAVPPEQALENLKAVLVAAGSSLDKVMKTTVFIISMEDFTKMNAVYSRYFGEGPPARSTIQVGALPKGAKVEIEAIAISKYKKHANNFANHPDKFFFPAIEGKYSVIISIEKKHYDEIVNFIRNAFFKVMSTQETTQEVTEEEASSDEVSEEEALAGWEEVSGVPVMEEETKEEEKVEEEEKTEEEKEERVKVTEEEIEKIVMKHGLMKVKLVVFNLPSEYKGSRVQFDMTNRHAIIRFSDEIDITKIRTLRRAFYRILNEMAWKSLVGWVLMRDANMARLNEVIKALNEELKTERAIYIVESYFPRKVLEEWLADYIVEVKMRIDEIKQKIEEKAEELKTVRRLKSELKKMEELLKRLENEMRLLQSPQ